MTSASTPDYQVFDVGNMVLQSGLTYRGAKLAYKTYGALNAERSNAIVYCTPYSAHHTDIEYMVAPGAARFSRVRSGRNCLSAAFRSRSRA